MLESRLGRTTKLKHIIDTGTAPPIRQYPRRVPPADREVVKELLDQMKRNDVIQPSSSAWASPIVLAKKKDGGVRFCVDFRRMNEVTRKDAYPLPRIDDTLETLSQPQLFSTLDLASGYWQVELAEESREKTAFSTTEGLYEFKVMPFGLCNAPATFQRLMDLVLSGLQWSNCLVYIDDIMIMGKTFQEHLKNMEQVFARSFDLLRNLLSSSPILIYPDFTKPFILDTDANFNYELTIVPYNGFTEPRNRKDKLPDGWKKCSSLNLKSSIVRACMRHTNADALSRLPFTQCGLAKEQGEEEDVLPVAALQISGLNKEEIRKMQAQNEWKLLIEARKSNIQPSLKEQEGKSIEFRRLCQIWDQLLLVPAGLRKRVLEETHDGLCGGHLGEEKTFQKLKLSHYWPGYWNSVRDWCKTCAAFASRKTPAPKNKASLQSIVVGSPMQMVAVTVDILGPLPQTPSGNKYVLVAGDYFTKWIEAYAIPNQEAITIAQKLLDEMFCRFSLPEKLHSDQGRQFESEIVKQLCRLLKIEKTCLAYHTSVQSTTGYSPFFLMLGREARLPIDIGHEQPTSEVPAHQQYGQYVQNQSEAFLRAFEVVRKNVSMKQCHQRELYNRKIHGDQCILCGRPCLVVQPSYRQGAVREALETLDWFLPCSLQTLGCHLYSTYQIKHTGNNKSTVVHFDRLKTCPTDIRLPARRNGRPESPPAPPPTSAGFTLELVPEEDAVPGPAVTMEREEEPDPGAAPARRYLDSVRTPPVLIRDEFSEEGSVCNK
eukprot:Em0003g587a